MTESSDLTGKKKKKKKYGVSFSKKILNLEFVEWVALGQLMFRKSVQHLY